MLAVCEVMKEQKMDGRKLLILSLGTGAADQSGRYVVGDPSKWGLLRWLWYSENNGSPLIDILTTAPDEMISTYISTIFKYCGWEDNYYRLQVWVTHIWNIFPNIHIYCRCVEIKENISKDLPQYVFKLESFSHSLYHALVFHVQMMCCNLIINTTIFRLRWNSLGPGWTMQAKKIWKNLRRSVKILQQSTMPNLKRKNLIKW